MGYRKNILATIIFVLITIYSSTSFAHPTSIIKGLLYLQSAQSLEGYWGDASEVPYNSFVETCTVAETLIYRNEIGTTYNSAIQWINTTEVFNNDHLFTKMLVLAHADVDVSTIRDYLLTIRNDDGGWGVAYGFESDAKRTALALQSLKAVNYSDQTVIQSAINYLLSTQNSDGGYGFYQGDESNVYMTALVLNTLSQFKSTYNLQTPINNAVAYLLAKQNPDGGFGSSPSTVYETALVFEALIASGAVGANNASAIQNAINYLTSTQLPNGSWDDDPYSTALALRALTNIKPNLSVNSADITFSNPTPSVGETITITATIHNTGTSPAENVIVQFHDGDPLAGGSLIGETTILSVPSHGNSPASISFTIPTASSKTISIKIDPLNVIDNSYSKKIANKEGYLDTMNLKGSLGNAKNVAYEQVKMFTKFIPT